MIVLLSVPHSGTRWMHGILSMAGYDLTRNSNKDGRHGIVLHWHYAPVRLSDSDWQGPKIGLLRDPLATVVSHWRSKEDSEVPATRLWPQRLDELRKGWQVMLEHQHDTFFFPVENPTGGQKAAVEDIVGNAAFKSPLNFIGVDKHAHSYPLKDAYLDRDIKAMEEEIPDGLALAREIEQHVGHIYYDRGYDRFWWV